MQKLRVEAFLELARQYPVLDVRSPGEYDHAHIPEAYNLPLFTDEERKAVGTAYKQEGREQAIKIGLEYFGPKMRQMVEAAEQIVKAHQGAVPIINAQFSAGDKPGASGTVLVHCWRGGMRSAGVAWLLDMYGFRVFTLAGGYKSFRNWVLQQFGKPYQLNVLGGYTGSGKTEVLGELSKANHPVIDLERIAGHKGSAFGALGSAGQPTQEMFENKLAVILNSACKATPGNANIWIEDESQRIGLVNLPNALHATMQRSPLYFLEVPFEERLSYIVREYGKFNKDELVTAIMRLQKRLGGQNTKNAINYLLEDNCRESFRVLLGYYDKYYARGLKHRQDGKQEIITIRCAQVDAKASGKMLMDKKTVV